jgi:CheY-like chemotaxis protein
MFFDRSQMAKMTRKPNVLLVDDEESILATLRLVFEAEGYGVHTAHSCQEALTMLQDSVTVDAVITDLNMEKKDIGLEVARFARTLKPAPVVVVCTGYANPDNARRAMALHIDYLVQKPVDLSELKDALRRLLRLRKEKRLRK